jgi:geranylgeranyl pyrophosphate synthase
MPEKAIASFTRHLGIAYQIHNDLEDWSFDASNKKQVGSDLLSGRPTVLWALALEKLPEQQQKELIDLQRGKEDSPSLSSFSPGFEQARDLYREAGVFDHARRLAEKHTERAREIARQLPAESLRGLLFHFLEAILPSSYSSL